MSLPSRAPTRAFPDSFLADAEAPPPRRALRALPSDEARTAAPAHLAPMTPGGAPSINTAPPRAIFTPPPPAAAAPHPPAAAPHPPAAVPLDPATVTPVLPAFAPDRLSTAARRTPPTDQARVWTPRTAALPPPPPLPAVPAVPAEEAEEAEEARAAGPTRPTVSGAPRHGTGVAPRRGIAPSPRPRRVFPLTVAGLAVGAASLALVIANLQGAPGGPAALAPTANPTQIAAIETRTSPAAAPTGVTTQFAAGAFAAPETGGVKLVSHASGPLSGKVIVVDPGHNGGFTSSINNRNYYTFGAGWRPCAALGTTTYTGITEHTIVWQIANKMVGLLLAQGATVVLTRADDTGFGPCNNERPEIANREGANLFLSIHVDGNETTSLRGFHLTYSSRMAGGDALTASSAKAADIVMQHLLSGTLLPASNYMQKDGISIVSRTDLAVLDGIRGAPAVLMESGNSRNPDDVALLTSEDGQLSIARALVASAVQIVGTLPADTTVGPASPSPEAPAGASIPPTNTTPFWETPTASTGNDAAGPEYIATPGGTPTASTSTR